MTPEEASELARSICKHWRTTIPVTDWHYELTHGHYEREPAWSLYRDLCGKLEDPGPSIPRWRSAYRAMTAPDVQPAHKLEPVGPRLTRQQRYEILTSNGAPRHMINRKET